MTFDMTRGSPGRLLVRFALPLIFSAILQQLYTLCDSVIVGRLLGENAFASVGAASLRVRSAFVAAMYLLCAWRAAIGGMGNAVIPMLSGFLELGLKTAAVLTLPPSLGLPGLYLMDAAAWVPVALFLWVCYRRILRQRLNCSISQP